MDQRSKVPPRREAIIQQYTAEHECACVAKDEAEKVQGWAEAANDRRDFTAASHFWERSHRLIATCKRHREAELELRKEEYALYNHLDDESERQGLFKLIQYSERRIERLHSEMSKHLVKSRISYLKRELLKQETRARQSEKLIVEEDLHNKAKGRSNIAFGAGWDEIDDGWGHRPPLKKGVRQDAQAQAASRLRWLEGQNKYAMHQVRSSIEQIKHNEAEWEAIRAEEQARDAEWARLDEDARRHWAKLPVREYEAEAYKALERRKEEAAEARRKKEEAEKARQEEIRLERLEQQKREEEMRLEEQAKRKAEDEIMQQEHEETEKERHKLAEEQARWEEEYALEEDPDFAWQPTQQASATLVASKIGTTSEQVSDTEAAKMVAEPSYNPATAQNGEFKEAYDDRGWGADFDKALQEGNNDLTIGLSAASEVDESMFAEFLDQTAFTNDDDDDAPGTSAY